MSSSRAKVVRVSSATVSSPSDDTTTSSTTIAKPTSLSSNAVSSGRAQTTDHHYHYSSNNNSNNNSVMNSPNNYNNRSASSSGGASSTGQQHSNSSNLTDPKFMISAPFFVSGQNVIHSSTGDLNSHKNDNSSSSIENQSQQHQMLPTIVANTTTSNYALVSSSGTGNNNTSASVSLGATATNSTNNNNDTNTSGVFRAHNKRVTHRMNAAILRAEQAFLDVVAEGSSQSSADVIQGMLKDTTVSTPEVARAICNVLGISQFMTTSTSSQQLASLSRVISNNTEQQHQSPKSPLVPTSPQKKEAVVPASSSSQQQQQQKPPPNSSSDSTNVPNFSFQTNNPEFTSSALDLQSHNGSLQNAILDTREYNSSAFPPPNKSSSRTAHGFPEHNNNNNPQHENSFLQNLKDLEDSHNQTTTSLQTDIGDRQEGSTGRDGGCIESSGAPSPVPQAPAATVKQKKFAPISNLSISAVPVKPVDPDAFPKPQNLRQPTQPSSPLRSDDSIMVNHNSNNSGVGGGGLAENSSFQYQKTLEQEEKLRTQQYETMIKLFSSMLQIFRMQEFGQEFSTSDSPSSSFTKNNNKADASSGGNSSGASASASTFNIQTTRKGRPHHNPSPTPHQQEKFSSVYSITTANELRASASSGYNLNRQQSAVGLRAHHLTSLSPNRATSVIYTGTSSQQFNSNNHGGSGSSSLAAHLLRQHSMLNNHNNGGHLGAPTTSFFMDASIRSVSRAAVVDTIKAEDMTDEVGMRYVNQYMFLESRGKGCQGEVFCCLDTMTNEYRAIKVMHRGLFENTLTGQTIRNLLESAEISKQIRNEIKILQRCRHPNIVALFEVIDDPSREDIFLVMQFVEHGALFRIDGSGKSSQTFTVEKFLHYAKQLCAGLCYLHKRSIAHRDIKPENILRGAMDTVYVADFGISDMVSLANEAAAISLLDYTMSTTANNNNTESPDSTLSGSGWMKNTNNNSGAKLMSNQDLLLSMTDKEKTAIASRIAAVYGVGRRCGTTAFQSPEMLSGSDSSKNDLTGSASRSMSNSMSQAFSDSATSGKLQHQASSGSHHQQKNDNNNNPEYSEEQLQAADVWALGLVFYCMLYGSLPFDSSDAMTFVDNIVNTPFEIPKMTKPVNDDDCPESNNIGGGDYINNNIFLGAGGDGNTAGDNTTAKQEPEIVPRSIRVILSRMLHRDPAMRANIFDVRTAFKEVIGSINAKKQQQEIINQQKQRQMVDQKSNINNSTHTSPGLSPHPPPGASPHNPREHSACVTIRLNDDDEPNDEANSSTRSNSINKRAPPTDPRRGTVVGVTSSGYSDDEDDSNNNADQQDRNGSRGEPRRKSVSRSGRKATLVPSESSSLMAEMANDRQEY